MSADEERANRRLARQSKRDVRLTLSMQDYFEPKLNTGGGRSASDINTCPIFISHQHGKLSARQQCAVNAGFYIMTQRRCYCYGDCECGSTMRFDA